MAIRAPDGANNVKDDKQSMHFFKKKMNTTLKILLFSINKYNVCQRPFSCFEDSPLNSD